MHQAASTGERTSLTTTLGSLISPPVRKIHAGHAGDHVTDPHDSNTSAPNTLPCKRILQMINMHRRRESPHLVLDETKSLNIVPGESCLLG